MIALFGIYFIAMVCLVIYFRTHTVVLWSFIVDAFFSLTIACFAFVGRILAVLHLNRLVYERHTNLRQRSRQILR